MTLLPGQYTTVVESADAPHVKQLRGLTQVIAFGVTSHANERNSTRVFPGYPALLG